MLDALSADGRFVVFTSGATSLAGAVGPTTLNVYLHDRSTGANRLVSRSSRQSLARANGNSTGVAVSPDGRFVLFSSRATDLVAGQSDTANSVDTFVYDRQIDTVELISRDRRQPGHRGRRPAGGDLGGRPLRAARLHDASLGHRPDRRKRLRAPTSSFRPPKRHGPPGLGGGDPCRRTAATWRRTATRFPRTARPSISPARRPPWWSRLSPKTTAPRRRTSTCSRPAAAWSKLVSHQAGNANADRPRPRDRDPRLLFRFLATAAGRPTFHSAGDLDAERQRRQRRDRRLPLRPAGRHLDPGLADRRLERGRRPRLERPQPGRRLGRGRFPRPAPASMPRRTPGRRPRSGVSTPAPPRCRWSPRPESPAETTAAVVHQLLPRRRLGPDGRFVRWGALPVGQPYRQERADRPRGGLARDAGRGRRRLRRPACRPTAVSCCSPRARPIPPPASSTATARGFDVYLYDRNVDTAFLMSRALGESNRSANGASTAQWLSGDAGKLVAQQLRRRPPCRALAGRREPLPLRSFDRRLPAAQPRFPKRLSCGPTGTPTSTPPVRTPSGWSTGASASNLVTGFRRPQRLLGSRTTRCGSVIADLYYYDVANRKTTLDDPPPRHPRRRIGGGLFYPPWPAPTARRSFSPAPPTTWWPARFLYRRATRSTAGIAPADRWLVSYQLGNPNQPCGSAFLKDVAANGRCIVFDTTCAYNPGDTNGIFRRLPARPPGRHLLPDLPCARQSQRGRRRLGRGGLRRRPPGRPSTRYRTAYSYDRLTGLAHPAQLPATTIRTTPSPPSATPTPPPPTATTSSCRPTARCWRPSTATTSPTSTWSPSATSSPTASKPAPPRRGRRPCRSCSGPGEDF